MASKQRAIYWDTSVFLCFLRKNESERRAICEDILRHARDGKVSLYTSSFTVTEVIKPLRMETTGPRPLSSDEVEDLQGMFHWPWLKKIALDHRVAQDAVNLGLTFALTAAEADRGRRIPGDDRAQDRAAVGHRGVRGDDAGDGRGLLVLRRRGQLQDVVDHGAIFLRAGPRGSIAGGRGDVCRRQPERDPRLARQSLARQSLEEESMTVQLICCSHSPLMTTDVEESERNVHAGFFQELESASAAHASGSMALTFGESFTITGRLATAFTAATTSLNSAGSLEK